MAKKIIILIIILGVVITAWLIGKSSSTKTESNTYQDPQGVFSFTYPSQFSVSGRDESILARVTIQKSYMPNTNFSDAELTINWASGGTDTTCAGRSLKTEGAAGNRYETTTIKKLYDGDCYTFEYIIHSTNLGNYDPSQGVREFDNEKIKADLESIIKSFKYLVNSD